MASSTSALPYFASGEVVKGFGRGSKELGMPTANFDEDVVDSLPDQIECGVYYGWAQVPELSGPKVHKMVMSIGWNPFYQNEKKSMETHILDLEEGDFYGSLLKVAIVGYIRPQRNFSSKEELIEVIKEDVRHGSLKLDSADHKQVSEQLFFNIPLQNGSISDSLKRHKVQ